MRAAKTFSASGTGIILQPDSIFGFINDGSWQPTSSVGTKGTGNGNYNLQSSSPLFTAKYLWSAFPDISLIAPPGFPSMSGSTPVQFNPRFGD